MKNFKALCAICLSTIAFSGSLFAQENQFDNTEVRYEIASSLAHAIADTNTLQVAETAKLQLNQMSLQQTAVQFLALINYQDATQEVKIPAISE